MDSTNLPPEPLLRPASQPDWKPDRFASAVAPASSANDRQGFMAALDKSTGRQTHTMNHMPVDAQVADPDKELEEPANEKSGSEESTADMASGRQASSDAVTENDSIGMQSGVPGGGDQTLAGGSFIGEQPETHLTMASSAALSGSANPESLVSLLRHAADSSLAGQAMTFEVIGGDHGISALQLAPGSAGWNLRLAAERGGRDVLRRHVGTLEASLAEAGQIVSAVQFVEGRLDD